MPNDTAEKQRAHRKRRLAKGQCVHCSFKVISARFCGKHLEKERIRSERRRERALLSGKCLKCNAQLDKEADVNYSTCITCRERLIMPIVQMHFGRRRGNATISD